MPHCKETVHRVWFGNQGKTWKKNCYKLSKSLDFYEEALKEREQKAAIQKITKFCAQPLCVQISFLDRDLKNCKHMTWFGVKFMYIIVLLLP